MQCTSMSIGWKKERKKNPGKSNLDNKENVMADICQRSVVPPQRYLLGSIWEVQTNPYSLVESISKTPVMSVACFCCIMGKQL